MMLTISKSMKMGLMKAKKEIIFYPRSPNDLIIVQGLQMICANIFQLAPGNQSLVDAGTSQNTSMLCYFFSLILIVTLLHKIFNCIVKICCIEK